MKWDDRMQKQIFAVASVGLALLSVGLYWGLQQMKQETAQLQTSNEVVMLYKQRKQKESGMEPERVIPADALSEAADSLRAHGLPIEDVSELDAQPMKQGEIHTLNLEGTGSFQDILSIFDIVHENRYWLLVDIESLRREGTTLRYVVEIKEYKAFQDRG